MPLWKGNIAWNQAIATAVAPPPRGGQTAENQEPLCALGTGQGSQDVHPRDNFRAQTLAPSHTKKSTKILMWEVCFVWLAVIFASPVAQLVKNLPAVQETRLRARGGEDPLEKEMAIHSSILPGEFHGQRSRGRIQSVGLQRVGHDWVISLTLMFDSIFFSAQTIIRKEQKQKLLLFCSSLTSSEWFFRSVWESVSWL